MELDDKQESELDFLAIANEWFAALSGTAFSPFGYDEVRNKLAALAEEATELLYQDLYHSSDAERIGAALAQLHYVQGDALGISIKVLSHVWLRKMPATKQDEEYWRLTMLLGDIANGYYKEATTTILNHQETIREAQMKTLRKLHMNLQDQRDLLRLTAERLQTLHDVESGILAAQSAEAIADISVTHIMRIIPCHSASIVSFDFSRDVMVILASKNTPEKPGNLLPLSLTTKERLQVLAESKSLFVNDIGALKNRPAGLENVYNRGVKSLLNVPLLSMDRLIGVLALASTEVGAFNEQHEVIARQIAGSVSIALHNRNLLETEKQARQESETLREVAASLSSTLEREELLDYILNQLEEAVPYDGAAILLRTDEKMQVVAQRGYSDNAIDALNNLDELPPNIRRLITQRKPLIVPDSQKDPDWIKIPGFDPDRCWLGAPLITQGVFIGLLGLSKNEPDYYQQSAADLVLTFANHAAVAIENARLYQEVQQHAETLRDNIAARTRDLESLYGIAAVTSQSLDLQTILRTGLLRTLNDLRCQSGAIHILDQEEGVLNLVEHHNLNTNQIKQIRQIDPGNQMLRRLLLDQETLVAADTSTDPRLRHGIPPVIAKSYAGTPMRARAKVYGILSLYCEYANDFTDDDIKLFASIADHLGVAIDNALLQKQAERAAVTEERERLARNLHDSATQSLFSLTLFAAAAREKVLAGRVNQALQHLDDIRYTANQTHREMRLLLHELGTPEPIEEGFSETLERRLRAVEGRSGIVATFRPLHTVDVGAEVEQALYQIATEALNNALKYSEGTTIDVQISDDDIHVVLSVKDNGVGFDLVEARKGAGRGLTNMKLRAGRMGGEMSIITSIGQGTEIVAKIPVSGAR